MSTTAIDRKDSFRTPKLWWVAAFLALAIALYGSLYVVRGHRAFGADFVESFSARPWGIFTHALFGPFALLTGIIQFLPSVRKPGRWRLHRIAGLIYVVSAIAVATVGLYMSFYSLGGLTTHLGFGALAIGTIVTTAQGYLLIRNRKIIAHRRWMLRSYSLIFGAVTLRIWLPLLIVAFRGDFIPAYQIVAWLSWVPNLIVAELMIRRGWAPSFKLGGDSTMGVTKA